MRLLLVLTIVLIVLMVLFLLLSSSAIYEGKNTIDDAEHIPCSLAFKLLHFGLGLIFIGIILVIIAGVLSDSLSDSSAHFRGITIIDLFQYFLERAKMLFNNPNRVTLTIASILFFLLKRRQKHTES